MPTGFIPQQDKGYLIAASSSRRAPAPSGREAVMSQDQPHRAWTLEIDDGMGKRCSRSSTNAVAGNSFVLSAYGSNFGSMFIILDGFDQRRDPELYADAIAAGLRTRVRARRARRRR